MTSDQEIRFEWDSRDVTPELLQSIGAVTLWWSMTDDTVTYMVNQFWEKENPGERQPRPFDRRIKALNAFAKQLYLDRLGEPDEFRLFRWYITRVCDANGRRDDIAHGVPGTITKNGRTCRGLMIPFPSRLTRYEPMTEEKISALGQNLRSLYAESTHVAIAFFRAQVAASPDIEASQDRNAYIKATKDNRSPMLPRIVPPPATFQG